MAQVSLNNAEVYIGGLNGIKVDIGDGNLTYTENRPMMYSSAGLALDDVKEDDDKPVDVTLNFQWKRATATPKQLQDKIKGAVGLTSSDTESPCAPYAVDIVIKIRSNCTEPAVYRQITLPNYRYESFESDVKTGMINTSGKCKVVSIDSPTIVTG